MKRVCIYLWIVTRVLSQSDQVLPQSEVEDPDERIYTIRLLDQIFYPRPGSTQSRASAIIRQRLQFSPSHDDWRILHKGWLKHEYVNLSFLVEQDPGEALLTDHSVFTILSNHIPGFDKLIIGSFNVSWGSGLLLNQSSSRLSLSPGSLTSNLDPKVRPHYSSREEDFFQGLAGRWDNKVWQHVAFVSNRRAMGQWKNGNFREDSDGIHPSGKTMEYHNIQDLGFSSLYTYQNFQLFVAARMNSLLKNTINTEFGGQWIFNSHCFVQVFTDNIPQAGRIITNWNYKTDLMWISFQYRYFRTSLTHDGESFLSLVSSKHDSEHGFSLRVQSRLRKYLTLRFAMDTGSPLVVRTIDDETGIVMQKAQVLYRRPVREVQIDWSSRKEGPIYPDNIWQDTAKRLFINKAAVSLYQKLPSGMGYRLNLKTASNGELRSMLLQQRIRWDSDKGKIGMGFVRYVIPNSTLRLSIYESGLIESFNFFTAFKDGQRWFLYFRYKSEGRYSLESQISQTRIFSDNPELQQPSISLQLSIVL